MNGSGPVSALVAGAALLGLTGCASIPAPLEGEYAERPAPSATTPTQVGETFRWGGTVVATRPGEAATCLELLARELDRSHRPRESDRGLGRFRACHDGFLDPEIFAPGREVTVIGRLQGFETDSVGDYPYRFPRLETRSVYLWPERVELDERYDPLFHGPMWRYHAWPYWPYGGPYWIGRHRYFMPYPARDHLRSASPATSAPKAEG
ncbi:Slp family lipoprotein [Halomonas denitrificans]|nr:Slp family lipoprotein [Halomonas denitrificans]